MRSMVSAAIVTILVVLPACETTPPLDSNVASQAPPVQAGADAAAASPAGGPVAAKGGASTTFASDGGTKADAPAVVLIVPPPQAPPSSCEGLAAAGAPDTLVDFFWSDQVAPGQSSRVWDDLWIEQGCQLRFQHEDAQRTTTMSAGDCASARAWATNARVLEVLRTGVGCPYGDGNATETLELTLTDQGRVARKTYKCPEPTLEVLRACLRPLVDRYFPR
jgi:hypothetical protein